MGLCHSVFWTIDTLAGYLGLPREEIDHVSAGVNHLAFLLRLEHRGRDLYPDLRAFVAAGRVPDDDLVRAELFRRLGYYPTESSEHHAEYNPWFIPKGDSVERFHIPIGEYLDRVAHNLDETEATNRRLDAGEPFDIERSGEYAAVIIHSAAHRASRRASWRNVPNRGAHQQPRRRRLRGGAGAGRRHRGLAVSVGRCRSQCAAYIHPAVDTQLLTVRAALHQDRDAIYHAVMQDPQVRHGSRSTTWRMTDELIAAEAEWLPAWLQGWSARAGRRQEGHAGVPLPVVDSRHARRRGSIGLDIWMS